jgi:hypothetical protein
MKTDFKNIYGEQTRPKTDPFGSYTGVTDYADDKPVQDADDL